MLPIAFPCAAAGTAGNAKAPINRRIRDNLMVYFLRGLTTPNGMPLLN